MLARIKRRVRNSAQDVTMKHYNIVTIFPQMFDAPFKQGVISKAIEAGIVAVNAIDLRVYAEDKHRTTDDYQYGGGVGLVMKPEPIVRAVRAIRERSETHVVMLDPRGEKFTQRTAERLSGYESLTFICGRYEGVDERVRELVVDEAISLGDFILTGGEFAAMTMIDAVARLIPGVLGDDTSMDEESFSLTSAAGVANTLEYPHYTRPPEYEGLKVPELLLSGRHADIVKWRAAQALEQTRKYRPELLDATQLDDASRKEIYQATATPKGKELKLAVALMHYPMQDKQGTLVTTSITNMDLHDISRSAATYGAKRYFVVTPLQAQREIAQKVISHWTEGFGAGYNSNRKEAFTRTELCDSILYAMQECEKLWGEKPLLVATTARTERATVSAASLGKIAESRPVLLLFGTGWGFRKEVFDVVDYVLEPILGASDFNHLSVRSAVAILLDRLTQNIG
jgi:tRNA (guanine37-N1)-methyltransferase